MWVAYYGQPTDRIFGRVEYSSEIAAIMDHWNNGGLYAVHDTDAARLPIDDLWEKTHQPPENQGGAIYNHQLRNGAICLFASVCQSSGETTCSIDNGSCCGTVETCDLS